MTEQEPKKTSMHTPWKRNTLRLFVPAVTVMILYGLVFQYLFLPRVEEALIRQKEQALKELANIALAQVDIYHGVQEMGMGSLDTLQSRALEKLKTLRFGPNLQNYFWVHDLNGTVLMHPTMPNLVGKNLYSDPGPDSTYPVWRMTDLAVRDGDGFVRYKWQYLEDSTRIEPKVSYVQYYEPWGWIIGNGAYLTDVQQEIESVVHLLRMSALVIGLILILFVTYLARISFILERRRVREEHRKGELLIELQNALQRVSTLRGLLPICSKCKKIRNDAGYWQSVETYITEHLDTSFSHGICPDCQKEMLDEMRRMGMNPDAYRDPQE
jgi:signal transduction histidine kinase